MKIFVGDIVKNEVLRSGKPKTQIAKEIKLSRNHLANILADEYMELEYVIDIGKSIRHDFSDKIPQAVQHILGEAPVEYGNHTNAQLRDELLDLQKLYINLQSEHIKLLNELRAYERAANLNTTTRRDN